ncbi:hypothetical protein [Halorussus sp. AFM4]|uniref:hypothetical protein n=1 Tax=Halorussus sp. AFM4 TaxID=3421651 RepID=UPI003EC10698
MTVEQLRDLAAGESKAAFRSAALACGMTSEEADLVWRADGQPVTGDDVVADVRESGMELRSDRGWLLSTVTVDLEEWR